MTIEQFNDAKYGELGFVHTGSIDDRMRKQVVAVVGSTKSERAYWLNLFPLGAGTLNDIKSSYFRSLGYTGSVQDMEHRYWASGKGSEDFIRAVAFGSGETGALFLPDPVSVYQDSAGTTAGVVGQPAGLTLDKRLGLGRLGDVVPAGSLDSGAGWTLGAGWSSPAGGSISGTAVSGSADLAVTMTLGVAHWVTYTISSISGGSVSMNLGSALGQARNVPGTYTELVTAATSSIVRLQPRLSSTPTLTVSSISAIPLPGNHVLQSTTTSRPTLIQSPYYGVRGDGADDYMTSATGGGGTAGILLCAAVTVSGGAGTVRRIWTDATTNVGYIFRVDSTDKLNLLAGNGAAFSSLVTAGTLPAGEAHVVTAWDDGSTLNVQIDNGAVASMARPVVAAGTAGFTLLGAASQFFPGDLHALVYVKDSALTADRRAAIKRAIGAKVGISL